MKSFVNARDDGERRSCVLKAGSQAFALLDAFKKRGQLQFPRYIFARIFPDGGFGRPHLRKHLVVREPLHTVAAAEAVHLNLAVAAIDLKGKQILPFTATDVKPS